MTAVRQRRLATAPGVELDVTEAGPSDGPVVVLLHGFPESAHSWRHQLGPLADAGYRVLAPDQRGYARSSAPAQVGDYSAAELTGDVCALLTDAGVEQGVIVGHDWGALLAWHMGMLHPERCRAVFAASVPYNRWPARPTDVFKRLHGDRFFYILYFQEPGVAEAELDGQVARFLRAMVWAAAGDSVAYRNPTNAPAVGTRLIDNLEQALGGAPTGLPGWLTAEDFRVFVEQFEHSGFRAPISWYRNFDTNYEATKSVGLDVFTMPTAFVAGQHDPVIAGRDLVRAQDAILPNHLGSTIVPGAGHWVQQERPDDFNEWLLRVLSEI
jgi:pimeloyl-ACP methyl ester carboxylesterase